MNNVVLIGRLTRDPDVRYAAATQLAVARFTLAIDRVVAAGKERQTDFPSVVAFGKTAEICERFLKKGRQVAVQGRIQTGSYQNKDGATVYTTDVVADRVELIGNRGDESSGQANFTNGGGLTADDEIPSGFEPLDDSIDDLPF
ncbi:MAG: single-stranded DNA-binding protein [Eubacteriales bacterium]